MSELWVIESAETLFGWTVSYDPLLCWKAICEDREETREGLEQQDFKCVPCECTPCDFEVPFDKDNMLPWLKANVDKDAHWPCKVRQPRPGVFQVRLGGFKVLTYRFCQDCGEEPGFCPMIRDDLWDSLGLNGIICWPCLVKRLGRELRFGDLAETVFNRPLSRVMSKEGNDVS